MKIDFNEEDIIKEIKENFSNDPQFFFDIIDAATGEYSQITETVKLLLNLLKDREPTAIEEIQAYIKEIENN